jgi:hypothetical protein
MNAFGAALMVWLSTRDAGRKSKTCPRCGVPAREECRFTMRLERQEAGERIETRASASRAISGCAQR